MKTINRVLEHIFGTRPETQGNQKHPDYPSPVDITHQVRRLWASGAYGKDDRRVWLHWNYHERDGRTFCIEPHFGKQARGFGAGIKIRGYEDNHDLSIHFSIPRIMSCWFVWTGFNWFRDSIEHTFSGTSYGFKWGEGDYVYLEWGHSDNNEGRDSEKGWRKSWFLTNVLLGSATVYQREMWSGYNEPIVMYEGSYDAKVTIWEKMWIRPRQPLMFTKRRRFAEVVMRDGHQVPEPGKGENSWDCDEDATYSSHLPIPKLADRDASIAYAVEHFTQSCIKGRARRGCLPDWVPENGPHGSKKTYEPVEDSPR